MNNPRAFLPSFQLFALGFLVAGLLFLGSYLNERSEATKTLTAKLDRRALTLAIISDNSQFLNALIPTIFEGSAAASIEVSSDSKPLTSFPFESNLDCLRPELIPMKHYGQKAGQVRFCLDERTILGRALRSPMLAISALLAIFLALISRLATLHRYQSEVVEVIDLLDSLHKRKDYSFDSLPISNQSDQVKARLLMLVRSIVAETGKLREDLAKSNAIAQTTQMLAHDIRKPFSLIQSLLDIVNTTTDADQASKMVKQFAPDIKKTIANANAMIADVMEVGSKSKPVTSEIDSTTVVLDSLRQCYQFSTRSKIQLEFNFNHTRKIAVDSIKMGRVFSNIINNADQAMGGTGTIWFCTKEVENDTGSYLEMCIGNSGTHIDAEGIDHLFEAFYTKGKKGGTGLGLAIAKKIVNDHGGEIWCTSSTDRGVEFFFTIPLSRTPIGKAIDLPASAKHLSEQME